MKLEKAVRKNEKLESLELESFAEVGKSLTKLERTQRSWKEPSEVGKNRVKLERTERSWNASFEVGKFWLRLASLNQLGKLSLMLGSSS